MPSAGSRSLVAIEVGIRQETHERFTPHQLRMENKVMLSGRTTRAPGLDLRLDQLGVVDRLRHHG